MLIVVPKSPLILVPCPRLVADCIQLFLIVPDPRSLIALDSVPDSVPVSLWPRPGPDRLEQFISVAGPRRARARGGGGRAEDVRNDVRGGREVAGQGELEHVVENILIEQPLWNGKKECVDI